MKTHTSNSTTTTTSATGDEKTVVVKKIQSIISRLGNTDMRQYYSGLLTFILCSATPNMVNILTEFSNKLESIYRSTNL
ncbi:MAG TPA: hypothetical protein VI757_06670 [Bacteroidia bacterium]|nr:hypothetical protein [Bacteroidia bacterium]